jgi:phosphoribosyl-ATP pyrophosphohydrolase/phosphoribosyl-AMP cyclohydrolase
MYGFNMKKILFSPDKLNYDRLNGLVPAVVIDDNTGVVLMVGFMNKESLSITNATGKVTFYSRSRKQLWTKGENSGNFLNVVNIKSDCDDDTLLIRAIPDGPTCHSGDYSCFKEDQYPGISFINELYSIIQSRKKNMPADSYTTKLFNEGENRIIQKVGEEAIETVIAAMDKNKKDLINETSDLVYHLLVLLVEKNITIKEIAENLQKRHKTD